MERDFTWINLYSEMANALRNFYGNRKELISRIYKVYESLGMKPSKLEIDGEIPEDIDPFTVFGLFNKGLTNQNRTAILFRQRYYYFHNELGLLMPKGLQLVSL